MIHIELRGKRLCAVLDSNHPQYKNVYIMVRSLLNSREIERNVWAIDYNGLIILRDKLNKFGLTESRTMDKKAHDLIGWISSQHVKNENIKNGEHNEYIKSLLVGKTKTIPYEDQYTAIAYLISNRKCGLFDEMGAGKAQPLDSKILTPTGWCKMGDIKIGDYAIGSNGLRTKVVGVFPQGKKETYRVVFNDGSFTECCEDHLWEVNTPLRRYRIRPGRIKSLYEIKKTLTHANGNLQHFVPFVKPIEFEKRNLPLDPYVLGVILGDGGISGISSVNISTSDASLIRKVKGLLPKGCIIKKDKCNKYDYNILSSDRKKYPHNIVTQSLIGLGLQGHKSTEKFIPEMYKFSDIYSRLRLLQGLLDTDGTISKRGSISFGVSCKELIDDVVFVVRSLGGKATEPKKKYPFYKKNGKRIYGEIHYRTTLLLPKELRPFTLKRKLDRYKPRKKYQISHAIKKIEYVGEKEVQCIKVDALDGLYVTDDCILTHNTPISLWSILAVSEVRKTLVVCPKTVIPGFIREIKKHTDLKYLEIPAGRKEASYFLKKHKDDDYNIMLVHPENLIGSKKNEIYGAITKILSKMVWDCVIVDEFHMYKNLSAKRTKCVLSLLTETKNREGKDPRCVLMTGTPVSENPLNAYTALKILSFVPHISRFKHYFCIEKEMSHGSGTHFEIVGYKNLDELKVWLDQVSIRRTKAEMKGFPEKSPPIERDVFLTGKHLEQYNLIRDEVVKELKEMSPKEVFDLQKWLGSAKAIRLRQILNHPGVLDAAGDSCKYKELDNVLEEILADKENKVVVWTEYRKAVDLLYERYNAQYGVQKLYGGVDITEDLIKDFEETNKKRVIAAIPAKAGTGTDFLARARYFIYVDLPYSYTLYKQSLDRGHRRIPQSGNLSRLDKVRSSPLTVIFLHAENTVDNLVRDKLYKKEDLVDALTVKDDVLIKMGREEVLRYLK